MFASLSPLYRIQVRVTALHTMEQSHHICAGDSLFTTTKSSTFGTHVYKRGKDREKRTGHGAGRERERDKRWKERENLHPREIRVAFSFSLLSSFSSLSLSLSLSLLSTRPLLFLLFALCPSRAGARRIAAELAKEKRGRRKTRKRDGEQRRESRYLILPSLAHPRQEINRERLALSSLPFPLSLFLSASVSVSLLFLLCTPLSFPSTAAVVRSLETALVYSRLRLVLPLHFPLFLSLLLPPFPPLIPETRNLGGNVLTIILFDRAICLSLQLEITTSIDK